VLVDKDSQLYAVDLSLFNAAHFTLAVVAVVLGLALALFSRIFH
jgi:hypothetical protein